MMPSWSTHKFLFQYLILCLFCLIEILSTNDYQHQLLKVDVGQDLTLSCLFDEDKLEQVSFMRQMTGDILSLGSELFVHQSYIQLQRFSPNRLDLKLLSVHENDSGIYTCMSNDERLISYFVEVFVPPRFVSYSPLEGSVSYAENSSMNLSCYAFAVPQVNLTWIFKDKNKRIQNIHQGENLFISSVDSSNSGLYECIASNQYHAAISRAFYVTVQYSPRVFILNDKLINSVYDSIVIKCRICSVPDVYQIIWLKEQQEINARNIHIQTQTINDQCSISILNIIKIDEDQFGEYECRAENSLDSRSDWILVERSPQQRKLKQKYSSEEINRNGRTALLTNKFTKKTRNQTEDFQFNELLLSNSIRTSFSFLSFFVFLSLILF